MASATSERRLRILQKHFRNFDPASFHLADPTTCHFRFFDLSGELRNSIYRFTLVPSGPISVGCALKSIWWRDHRILLVSRRVRDEALPIYLGENVFLFYLREMYTANSFFYQFLRKTRDQELQHLRNVFLSFTWKPQDDFMILILNEAQKLPRCRFTIEVDSLECLEESKPVLAEHSTSNVIWWSRDVRKTFSYIRPAFASTLAAS